uniref:Link domain-containing protein n=1 Tax=viral metagenome TaxID=1070528 RepID=A0A6C0DDJ2_9ZZZZ
MNSSAIKTVSANSMNASAASAASVAANLPKAAASFLSGWGAILLAIVLLVVLFAVYYQTIGYWMQIGWEKLGWSRSRNESVTIEVPGGGPSATLIPVPNESSTGSDSGVANIGQALNGVAKRLESDVESALSGSVSRNGEVFNVSRNLYTFGDAEPLCRAFGAELATYDQVKSAYEAGADWCNYGWIKGQLAVYPTQKSTYDKLQHGPENERMACGLPGLNGGYFPNAEQRFGVNCFGKRPAESALDERLQQEDRSATAYDREVNKFKAEIDSIGVNPWNAKQWSR